MEEVVEEDEDEEEEQVKALVRRADKSHADEVYSLGLASQHLNAIPHSLAGKQLAPR